ncbi:metallophosphoesterase [Pendulispora brunnea]|uniref:Metallophosphoesterase n=1 Tax=Pendulispora brunnea TaxID=2905690 RepID=A0ABZ2KCA1_9BACT
MRVLSIESSPVYEMTYLAAASGGGTESRRLPVLRASVDGLPAGLDGLLLTSDLQGVAPLASQEGAVGLLGEVLAEDWRMFAETGELPSPGGLGVVLAGDLYSEPAANKRGASGDVRPVWRAFAESFRWVAGVAGNHDRFGNSPREEARFGMQPGMHLLDDGHVVTLDGLCIGGVGGIVGEAAKPRRRDARSFVRAVQRALENGAELVVLHEGPDVPHDGRRGNSDVRNALDPGIWREGPAPIVVCGHVHWHEPLAEIRGGVQAVNVDGRAILLVRA